ncbi:MAG: dethiobiotin synthase [Armatimonadota bacterium]
MSERGSGGIFVTGTDTGVGKTVVTASLVAELRRRGHDAGAMKPVETGIDPAADPALRDAERLRRAAGAVDPPELVCPLTLREPLAPSVAARLEGREVELEPLFAAYRELRRRHDLLFVEGAGGLGVPLRDDYLMSDLARDLELPVLVVARPSLGTINHTLLTVRFARSAGLRVMGVVISGYPDDPDLAERTSPAEIERLAGTPILGIVPRFPQADRQPAPLDGSPLPDAVLEALFR